MLASFVKGPYILSLISRYYSQAQLFEKMIQNLFIV